MADIPGDGLEETRAALAPTLEATAAILPWLVKPIPPRFDPALNERWIATCRRLAEAWSNRHCAAIDTVRPAIFSLYGIALETADSDCLALGEALASAADQLEAEADSPSPRLVAALTASIECLSESGGLEHAAFAERIRHFSRRLAASAGPEASASERSPVLDRLFIADAREHLELMHDALAALPPDAYALKSEATHIANQAEHLELYGIMHLARQLAVQINTHDNLDNDTVRAQIDTGLRQLGALIDSVMPGSPEN